MNDCDITTVMAKNPYTDKLVNVEPFFKFLSFQQESKERIDQVIRMIVMLLSDQEEDLGVYIPGMFGSPSNMFLFLYDLSDMLSKISECGISIPKKKGAQQ